MTASSWEQNVPITQQPLGHPVNEILSLQQQFACYNQTSSLHQKPSHSRHSFLSLSLPRCFASPFLPSSFITAKPVYLSPSLSRLLSFSFLSLAVPRFLSSLQTCCVLFSRQIWHMRHRRRLTQAVWGEVPITGILPEILKSWNPAGLKINPVWAING